MKKTPEDIILLHMTTKNNDHMMYSSWDMVRSGWTDGRKRWHIEVGALPKNIKRTHVCNVEIRIEETLSLWKARAINFQLPCVITYRFKKIMDI